VNQRLQRMSLESLPGLSHSCPRCGSEICHDTNAAINILTKGVKMLGMKWNNSTQGHWESASEEGKHREKTTSTIDGQPDVASGLL